MTVLVRHDVNDYRLHHDDGTQIGDSASSRPNAAKMSDMIFEEHSDKTLTDKTVRRIYTDIVTNNIRYVDMLSGQVAPWGE